MVSAKALVIVLVFLSSLDPRAEATNGEDGSWFLSLPGECIGYLFQLRSKFDGFHVFFILEARLYIAHRGVQT